mmetsp:Transcript_4021/g.11354  ORF Transcript_4021/g.11354 Transcript_4021/m.11354 type:complete len:239 (-) Transcript_4021:28-744(-)
MDRVLLQVVEGVAVHHLQHPEAHIQGVQVGLQRPGLLQVWATHTAGQPQCAYPRKPHEDAAPQPCCCVLGPQANDGAVQVNGRFHAHRTLLAPHPGAGIPNGRVDVLLRCPSGKEGGRCCCAAAPTAAPAAAPGGRLHPDVRCSCSGHHRAASTVLGPSPGWGRYSRSTTTTMVQPSIFCTAPTHLVAKRATVTLTTAAESVWSRLWRWWRTEASKRRSGFSPTKLLASPRAGGHRYE